MMACDVKIERKNKNLCGSESSKTYTTIESLIKTRITIVLNARGTQANGRYMYNETATINKPQNGHRSKIRAEYSEGKLVIV